MLVPADCPFCVWSQDTFDRESRPLVDDEGAGVVPGLTALWRRVLQEGIDHRGRKTFTEFRLVFEPPGDERTLPCSIPVDPFENAALLRLREWAAEADAPEYRPAPARLAALAAAQARLLAERDEPSRHAGAREAEIILEAAARGLEISEALSVTPRTLPTARRS